MTAARSVPGATLGSPAAHPGPHSASPDLAVPVVIVSAVPGVDGAKLREALWSKHNIITTYMPHTEYSGLRVTPNVYTTLGEVDFFASMVEKELAS